MWYTRFDVKETREEQLAQLLLQIFFGSFVKISAKNVESLGENVTSAESLAGFRGRSDLYKTFPPRKESTG